MRLVECIRAAAFDLDGTLVDTAPDLAPAVNAMLAAFGLSPLAHPRVVELIGGGVERLVAGAFAAAGRRSATPDELHRAIDRFGESYAHSLFRLSRVYPGVERGLRSLAAAGKKLACVTNKHSRFTEPILTASGLLRSFELVLCADRPELCKPAPDLLLAACARFHVSPRELLYVGDSQTDVAAARAAGCPVALVDYGYRHDAAAEEWTPDWVIARIADLTTLTARQRLAMSDA